METIYGNPIALFSNEMEKEKLRVLSIINFSQDKKYSLLWESYSYLKEHDAELLEILVKENGIPFSAAQEQLKELDQFLLQTFTYLNEQQYTLGKTKAVRMEDYSITQLFALFFSAYVFNVTLILGAEEERFAHAFMNRFFTQFPEWGNDLISGEASALTSPFEFEWEVVMEMGYVDEIVEYLLHTCVLQYPLFKVTSLSVLADDEIKPSFQAKWGFQVQQLVEGPAEGVNTDYVEVVPAFTFISETRGEGVLNDWTEDQEMEQAIVKGNDASWFSPLFVQKHLKL